ncbi:MAG: UDP-glucose--hexose-1-phosphate uridylyltransferase [Desulfobacterales bacterium]|nr:UDP-glucose--hexose-1-phosphate uridylyltransferase [Desulfobacterales bacterium]
MPDRSQIPHQRHNPLTGQWLLLSPHRGNRPWQGRQESLPEPESTPHDPSCYLCPGNLRANEERNPAYTGTFVFDNDFPAILADPPDTVPDHSELIQSRPATGTCRVICFSHRHDLTLARMSAEEIQQVVATWMEQAQELGQTYPWVQIFENKGEIMGCSNPHPHGQIWASNFLPQEPDAEDRCQKDYFKTHHRPLLLDYLEKETALKERMICENDTWAALVPYWAVWPFETMVIPKHPVQRITDLDTDQQSGLSRLMKTLLVKYDNIFSTSFAYSMGWHGAPFLTGDTDHWQLHAHYYPPLLRSATVKKFMVGYEMLGCAQRDITPETAARIIRDQSDCHYTQKEAQKEE